MRGLFTQIFTAASIAGPASTAPRVREDGGWYGRALVAHDTLDGAEGWRGDAYGEYGLTSDWTVGAEAGPVYGSTATGFAGCDGYGFETRTGLGYSAPTIPASASPPSRTPLISARRMAASGCAPSSAMERI